MCERQDGMGTTGQAMPLEAVEEGIGSGVVKSRYGDKSTVGGTVAGGEKQGQERSGITVGNEISHCFPSPSRLVSVLTTFSCSDVYCACLS